ncbi:hypothetical protein GSUB_10995 [Geoalkalibacter subterraneus]|uniref:IPT/TIG domain-containing protein n=2 Tax=Geoalkalibacter subterraneus TaxID=483547 RepID=A0A0B5FFR1_9BACT|nr:hypothetical protein GSUB_10995 [Geoalkalibacter subterraneus]
MHRMMSALILLVSFLSVSSFSAEIVSLAPNTGEPGTKVTLKGGPFSPESRIEFGGEALSPRLLSESRVTFLVPEVPAGDYRITVRDGQESNDSVFFFRVTDPAPWVHEVSPSDIDICSLDGERRITIEGRNFHTEAQVLLDDAAIQPQQITAEQIVVQLPELEGGRHLLQVVNPDGSRTLPQALRVNSIPEIHSASSGEDHVNSYQVILTGKNFQYDSHLRVNGKRVEKAAQQRPGADALEYVDCTTLIYTRYPVSRELRRISLQVVNPGGEQSPVFHATMP